jgi:hypothetical protein
MLYPAALLPARSWKAMTGNLTDHFGDNATLDAATARTIEDYLTANAADAGGRQGKLLRRLDPAVTPARITDLPDIKPRRLGPQGNRPSPRPKCPA